MTGNKVFGVVVGLVIVAGVALAGVSSFTGRNPDTSGPRQAIFLADGQIYFGYASSLRHQVVTLVDVYYLQAQQPIQPSDAKTPAPTEQQVNLIKLGSELHGPESKMLINRDRINFIEDMKDDSEINKKIKEDLEKKAGS